MFFIGGDLDDREPWRPFQVVCIQSRSQGARHQNLVKACRELDLVIAEIFGIKLNEKTTNKDRPAR